LGPPREGDRKEREGEDSDGGKEMLIGDGWEKSEKRKRGPGRDGKGEGLAAVKKTSCTVIALMAAARGLVLYRQTIYRHTTKTVQPISKQHCSNCRSVYENIDTAIHRGNKHETSRQK